MKKAPGAVIQGADEGNENTVAPSGCSSARSSEPDFFQNFQAAADGDVATQQRVNAALSRLMWQPQRSR